MQPPSPVYLSPFLEVNHARISCIQNVFWIDINISPSCYPYKITTVFTTGRCLSIQLVSNIDVQDLIFYIDMNVINLYAILLIKFSRS